MVTRCFKITEKVVFNIASGQKFVKNAENSQFGKFLRNWGLWSNSVTRHADSSILIGSKSMENAKVKTFQMRHFEWFSNNVDYLSCGDKLWNQVGFGWTKNFSIESIVLEAAMEHFLWKGRSQVKIIRSFIYYSCREKRH